MGRRVAMHEGGSGPGPLRRPGDDEFSPARGSLFVTARKGAPTLAVPKPSSIVFAVGGRLTRADIPRLCDALRRLLEGRGVGQRGEDVGRFFIHVR